MIIAVCEKLKDAWLKRFARCPFPLKEKEQAEVRQSLTFPPCCYRKGGLLYTPGILWTAVVEINGEMRIPWGIP
jgi:hypothetical protein